MAVGSRNEAFGSRGARSEVNWFCVDCRHPVDLDRHGRCVVCASDAVYAREVKISLHHFENDVYYEESLWEKIKNAVLPARVAGA